MGVVHFHMVQERYDVLTSEREIEFLSDVIRVPVIVHRYEEEYVGTSRDEEYYEETDVGSETLMIECSLGYVYNDADPSEEYVGSDAVDVISERDWDVSIVDVETVELRDDGDLFIASYDASELEEYRE